MRPSSGAFIPLFFSRFLHQNDEPINDKLLFFTPSISKSEPTSEILMGTKKSIPSFGVEDYYKHDQQEQAEDDDARIPPESLFYVHGHTLAIYWLKFDL
jgi:hypothetical protein